MAFKDLLARFKKGLAKTAKLFDVRSWFGRKVDQDFLDELEAKLIRADVGVKATQTPDRPRPRGVRRQDRRRGSRSNFLKQEMKALLQDPNAGDLARASTNPTVILVAGVNGSGKTTSIAKLAQRLKDEGHSILLGRLRHLPRRRRRPARHLGRPRRGRPRPRQPGGRPGQRRPRRLRQGPGQARSTT